MNNKYILPMMALRGIVVMPNSAIGFDVIREKSKKAIDAAMERGRMIFLLTQKSAEIEDPGMDDLYKTGVTAKIKRVMKLPGGMVHVVVEGVEILSQVEFLRQFEDCVLQGYYYSRPIVAEEFEKVIEAKSAEI